MLYKQNRGFTLIELLVVIAIIGILSSVVLASLNSARQKSRDAKRVSDVKQLQLAFELYFDSCSQYPPEVASDKLPLLTENAGCGTGTTLEDFISVMPEGPGTNEAYTYSRAATTDYVIRATLEDSGHKALDGDIDGTVDGTVDCEDTNSQFCVQP